MRPVADLGSVFEESVAGRDCFVLPAVWWQWGSLSLWEACHVSSVSDHLYNPTRSANDPIIFVTPRDEIASGL